MLYGIGVHLDKSFSTKWFVYHLAKFGFSISTEEVRLFKQSAISVNSTCENHMTNFPEWVEDNVDHSIRKLTGKKKIHGMGLITISS